MTEYGVVISNTQRDVVSRTLELLSELPKDAYARLMGAAVEGPVNEGEERMPTGLEPDRPLPPFATSHPPGTLMKIEIMAWRFQNGFHLHHPDDAKVTGNPKLLARQLTRDQDNRPIHPDDVKVIRSLYESLFDDNTETE